MKLIDMDVAKLIYQTRQADANPGGGATLILVSNLAINLGLMMDKKDFKELENEADVSRETLLKISKDYESYMQDDVDEFNKLMDNINEKSASEDDYIRAATPLLKMVEKNIVALDKLSFFLENGKKSTLTDGEIANDLLYQALISSLPTIKLNLDMTRESFNLASKKDEANKLYIKNQQIIERRKQWQQYM